MQCRRKTDIFRKWVIVLQAHRGVCIQKGQLLVIFIAVRVCFFGMLIECLEVGPRFCSFAFAKSVGVLIEISGLSQSFAFPEKFVLSEKATHSYNPIASL